MKKLIRKWLYKIFVPMDKHGMRWSDRDIQVLGKMVRSGETDEQMSIWLGRTRRAIQQMKHRLNLND